MVRLSARVFQYRVLSVLAYPLGLLGLGGRYLLVLVGLTLGLLLVFCVCLGG